MSIRRRILIAFSVLASLAFTACAAPPPQPGTTGKEITVKNCGLDVTVSSSPQRIYAAYQPAVEMAHALGVSNRLVGTAYLDAAVLPEYAQAQAATNYLPELPSREGLLAANPDFVLSGFNGLFAESNAEGLGTRTSLRELGIQTWIFSPLCPSADGLSDEAIDPASVSMDNVYSDLRDLGRLFGVEQRAQEVIADVQARIDAVRQRVAGAHRPRVAVVSPQEDGTFRIASGIDFVTQILDIAGADNAFADLTSRRNITVGTEEIIARNPDIILTSTCCAASYGLVDAEPDAERIRTNPAFANVTAVRAGRVHPFLFADRAAGVRVPYAAELVASLVHPEHVES